MAESSPSHELNMAAAGKKGIYTPRQIRNYQEGLLEADRQRRLRSQYASSLAFPILFFLTLSIGLSSFSMYHLQNGPKQSFSRYNSYVILISNFQSICWSSIFGENSFFPKLPIFGKEMPVICNL